MRFTVHVCKHPSELFVLSCNSINPKSHISNLNDTECSLKLVNAVSPIVEQMFAHFQSAPLPLHIKQHRLVTFHT